MVEEIAVTNGQQQDTQGQSLYERSALGFQNYWYPACGTRQIGNKPKFMMLLGQPIALFRRGENYYALADECPHRGTSLSQGRDEFPGTNTISCRYHGWTYNLSDGMCVAVLTEGLQSKVVGKVRARTYPLEVRKGLIWIWMGKMDPVPIEEDVPSLLLRDDTVVKFRNPQYYGNWRFHNENVGGGHAQMVHRYSISQIFSQMPAHAVGQFVTYSPEEDDDGKWLYHVGRGAVPFVEYPGLGTWPKKRPWRRASGRLDGEIQGVMMYSASLRLPGMTRVPNTPMRGWLYYEWYVPVDEDHYIYFQIDTYWPKNIFHKLISNLRYFLWGKPIRRIRFNMQDAAMVRQTTDYVKRHGMRYFTPLTVNDDQHREWRNHCDRMARGEGSSWQDPPGVERDKFASQQEVRVSTEAG